MPDVRGHEHLVRTLLNIKVHPFLLPSLAHLDTVNMDTDSFMAVHLALQANKRNNNKKKKAALPFKPPYPSPAIAETALPTLSQLFPAAGVPTVANATRPPYPTSASTPPYKPPCPFSATLSRLVAATGTTLPTLSQLFAAAGVPTVAAATSPPYPTPVSTPPATIEPSCPSFRQVLRCGSAHENAAV